MTEAEIMERAREYIFKMANGINPLNDEEIKEDDFINNVRISRCLFYVAGVLERVRKNGIKDTPKPKPGREDFRVAPERLTEFEYSDRPIALTEFVNRLNELIDTETTRKLTYKVYATWLIVCKILEETEENGAAVKRPTKFGESLGIITEEKTGPEGRLYKVVTYNRGAQEFLIGNLQKFETGEILTEK